MIAKLQSHVQAQPSWDFFGKWRKRRNFNKEALKETKQKEKSRVQFDKKKRNLRKIREVEIWELN